MEKPKEFNRFKYLCELLSVKFTAGDVTKVTKAWGRSPKATREDLIGVQKLYESILIIIRRVAEEDDRTKK